MWRMNVTTREKLVKSEEKRPNSSSPISPVYCYPLLCFHEYHGVIDLYCLVCFLLLILVLVSELDDIVKARWVLIGQLLQDPTVSVIIIEFSLFKRESAWNRIRWMQNNTKRHMDVSRNENGRKKSKWKPHHLEQHKHAQTRSHVDCKNRQAEKVGCIDNHAQPGYTIC